MIFTENVKISLYNLKISMLNFNISINEECGTLENSLVWTSPRNNHFHECSNKSSITFNILKILNIKNQI